MRASLPRAVHKLTSVDIIQLGDDPRLYQVTAIERSSDSPDARCKVTLLAVDGAGGALLVRAGFERVLTVPR